MTGFASKRQSAWDKFAKPWNGIAGWEEIGKNMKTDEDDEFARIEMEQRMRETLAQPAQEPVFTYAQVKAHIQAAMMPIRPWAGLTDEERFEIGEKLGLADVAWLDLMQAIEAALRSKNT